MITKLLRERWTLSITVALGALYAALLHQQPAGEGFGRGWNLIAFWIYGSPAALGLGGLCFWRAGKADGALKRFALVVAWLAISFPVLAMLVMKVKS